MWVKSIFTICLACCTMMVVAQSSGSRQNYNVLFIIVDDLRPELGCYGDTKVQSPGIDKLAAQGVSFSNAYCQQALCSPSRTSLLTGLRPDATKVYDLVTHFRNTVPDVVTLPQHFKNNGYYTVGFGKIFHQDFGFDPIGLEDSASWTIPVWNPPGNWGRGYISEPNIAIAKRSNGRGPAVEMMDVPDTAYQDGQIAARVIEELRKRKNEPFFIAAGFHKPHLPFTAPKKYWDKYDRDKIVLPDTNRITNSNRYTLQDFGELRAYNGIPKKGKLSPELSRQLIHGYLACVSYMDAQVEMILEELKRLDLEKNTVVVLLGDHGWKLGEYASWSKHSNMEVDTRAPLIVSSPRTKAKGKSAEGLVEFVDVYPTICEEAGLGLPSHLQGKSLSPFLKKPGSKGKGYALSQHPRGKDIMGYSLRTKRYRFTLWQRNDGTELAVELYDHLKDPGEKMNVANVAEYKKEVERQRERLQKLIR